ncbi:MAG: hypothetical protein HY700_09435 [Gemmatimonadetes bacterium]|nr:hypothetical protein [Gemmatimonadota bacterium]
MQPAIGEWLSRLLAGSGAADAERLADFLSPHVEDALRASALDMLRQCSVAQFGELEDTDAVKEWTVSVNEAVAAAMRRVENKRQTV